MTTQRSSLKVRRGTGGTRTIGVEYRTSEVGRLLVAQVLPRVSSLVAAFPMGGAWSYIWGASSAAPQVLRRVRIFADDLQTVRLALMTTDNGMPTVANALLVYDYQIGGTAYYGWSGYIVLKDRYIYGYSTGAATVCSIYLEYELVTP